MKNPKLSKTWVRPQGGGQGRNELRKQVRKEKKKGEEAKRGESRD